MRANFILLPFQTRNINTLYKLFVTYVRPLLEYCTPVWSPSKQCYIDRIEDVQRRFTRRIFSRNGLFEVSYEERLTHLNNNSLLLRRMIYDQNLVYKIIMGHVNIDKDSLFTFSFFNHRTRGHHFRIITGNVRSQHFLQSFLVRVDNIWNDLPQELLLSGSLTAFNRGLEAFFKRRGLF